MSLIRVILSGALVTASAFALFSQTDTQRPSFEVASIKEHPFAPGLMGLDAQPGGRFVATMATVQMLITAAYDLLPAQLEFATGLPDAPLKMNYDIEAKSPSGSIPTATVSHDGRKQL